MEGPKVQSKARSAGAPSGRGGWGLEGIWGHSPQKIFEKSTLKWHIFLWFLVAKQSWKNTIPWCGGLHPCPPSGYAPDNSSPITVSPTSIKHVIIGVDIFLFDKWNSFTLPNDNEIIMLCLKMLAFVSFMGHAGKFVSITIKLYHVAKVWCNWKKMTSCRTKELENARGSITVHNYETNRQFWHSW